MTPQQLLTFEHPLNERIRTFLRTEFLFQLAKYRFNNLAAAWDSRDCIATVIELYNVLERSEIRSELLKEIERHLNSFQRLSETPSVNHNALNKVLNELEAASNIIKNYSTKQGFFPKENDLLNGIRQRINIPGGTCSFDIPSLHYWLNLPVKSRQHFLSQWIEVFEPLEKSLALVLELTRQSNVAVKEIAASGTYQKSLNPQSSCQLLRIALRSDYGVYPEISASKHRINLRFLHPNYEQGKASLAERDIQFELTCCMI